MSRDVKQWVQKYLDEGWSPIPIPKGEKGPRVAGWETKAFTPADFGDDDNIGVHLGSTQIYDVDLDDKAAAVAADIILPNTPRVSGRPGKPRSHRFFSCTDKITHNAYHGLGGQNDTIVELRGFSKNGSPTQTVVPPSVHPSGELVEWDHYQKPMLLDRELLERGVRDVAIAVLLARAFPGPGHRHDVRLALAGYLHRCGMDDRDILVLGEAVMRLIGGDVTDWKDAARTTLAKLKADKDAPVTGGPALAKALTDGDKVLRKLNAWLGREQDEWIDTLNVKHFWVRLGKDDVIGREDDPDGVVFQRPKALLSEYANQKIAVPGTTKDKKTGLPNMVMKPIFPLWLEHPRRRSYSKVVFAPPPRAAGDREYNLWQGYGVEPMHGDCSLFLRHMHEVICSSNDEHFNYLTNLLALTVQEPGTPSGVAVVLRGGQGTGKGVFVRTIGDLFGRRHYVQLDKTDQLTGKFNNTLSGKIIVFADEAFWAGRKQDLGALKRLITEPTLHVERKGIDSVEEDNHVHLFLATNEEWSWPAELDDRRGFLLHVSNSRVGDSDYWDALYGEIRAGGKAALLDYFLRLEIDRDLIKRVPKTKELGVQKHRSLGPLLEWWTECLWNGRLAPGTGLKNGGFGEWAQSELVFGFFRDWVKSNRPHERVPTQIDFSRRMSDLLSDRKSQPRRFGADVQRAWLIRTLGDARQFLIIKTGMTVDWPDGEESKATLDF